MGTRFYSIVVAAALAAPAASVTESKPEHALRIRIRVCDYAGLPVRDLGRAQEETSGILRDAGVETTWHKCAVTEAAEGADPECEKRRGPADLVLRILSRDMTVRLFADRNTYGNAFTAVNGQFASHANVFYHRIADLAKRRRASCPVLLGHFLAHEIGHLLLGPDTHSASGIMRVPFDEMQVRRALWGTVLFTPSEAGQIRREVMKRMEAGTPPTS